MEEPRIADKKPKALSLESGTYHWCRCGRSANQPFCDGSHQGTGFTPLKFEVTEERTRSYCVCKRSGTAPYCDGTHKEL